MSSPTISVVLPTYNGTAFLREALASVFAQTHLPVEVVVVDDASSDGTPDLVESIAAGAPVPVRLVRLPRNSGGPARPLNRGIEEARGEFIAVLDQDDTFAPDKLEVQGGILAREPACSLVGSFCSLSGSPGRPDPFQQRAADRFRQGGWDPVSLPGREALRLLIHWGNYLVGYPGFLFRKRHWRQKGGVDESLAVGSDMDLACWLCLRGKVAFLPVIHYVRREHSGNVCNNRLKMYLDLARVRARYLAGERWLLDDEELSRDLRGWFPSFAYLARLAGNYRASWECYRLHARVWGWNGPTLKALLKLPLHWLWASATRRPPVYCEWTHPGGKPGDPQPGRRAA